MKAVMTKTGPSGEDSERTPRSEGANLDYIEYYDDGEWHAVLMDGNKAVASGFGTSPQAARESLFGKPDLD